MLSDDPFRPAAVPTGARPLLGTTVLLVEDSRLTGEALRLLCLRSGARLRRADSLATARRHLQVYRPTTVIVDVGLPDGSGMELIAELARARPRVEVLLATSGDDALAEAVCAAGADGFLPKPVQSLAAFQSAILAQLPKERRPEGPRAVSREEVSPDPGALRADLVRVLPELGGLPEAERIGYLVQFLCGVARTAGDLPLAEAARALASDPDQAAAVETLRRLIESRLLDQTAA